MKKIIVSFLVLLLVCFAGCTASHNNEENSPTELQNNDVLVCTLIEYLREKFVQLYDADDLLSTE